MIDQHSSLSEKFLKKGFWLYFFGFIIAPLGYVIRIIISGELSVSEVGILYGIISLITLLSAYNDLGMSESINYFVPKYVTEKRFDKVKTILVYSFLAQLSTGIIISLFFIFGADYIAINYFKTPESANILKIFALYFLGTNIFQVISTYFIAIQNTFLNKAVSLCRIFFIMIFTVIIFVLDISSLVYFSYAWISGLYFGVIFALYSFHRKYYTVYLKNEPILWDKKLFTEIYQYAFLVFIGASASTLLSQIDMQMVIYILGTTQAGYYTNYLSIMTIPFLIITPIFTVLFPIFSELHAKKQSKKIKDIKAIFTKIFIIIAISFNIGFFIFGESIAYILFGYKFITSGVILKYSILLLVFNFLLQINFHVLGGTGKVMARVKIMFVAVVFNLLMNILLIKYIGVYGAALATGLGWLLIWILSEIALGKEYYTRLSIDNIIKNVICMGIFGYISYTYIIPIMEGLTRVHTFLYLLLVSIVWLIYFILVNKKEFSIFISEIKKLKGKT